MNQDNHEPPHRSNSTNYTKLIIIILVVFFVLTTGAGLGFLTASIQTMPNLSQEMRPAASSQFFDIRGKLITTTQSVENRLPVSIKKVPKNLQNAFVAAEDARFYQHIGIDPRGILRAVWTNITNRGVTEGGSTITQQLAKNALLTQERTLKRKFQEAVLAIQIERQYSKREILEMYLNQIYFGQGAYGVQSAAMTYFGKNVEDLNLAECALLAGIPKSPNYYSPYNNIKAAKERQSTVLDQMVRYGYISQTTANNAKKTKLNLSSGQSQYKSTSYFIDYVTQLLINTYGADAVYKDGLKIYTTLDLDMQKAAEQAMKELPTTHTDKNKNKQPQGALVAIDPRTGFIKAMIGGRGTDQFNRAVLAERQPGSAFKPFVYLAALESGMTPATILEDSPITYKDWSPQNYDNKFRGKVSLRTALEHSLNVIAVKITQKIGPDKPLYYAQQMGISSLVLRGNVNDRNLAMSLGGLTKGITPLEMASAYGVLANRGVLAKPFAIIKVVDRSGKILENNVPREKVAINERTGYVLVDMMRGVITKGTGGNANINRPAAGKTGTTSDYKDAWFVGFTPDLSTAVWIGNDNGDSLDEITGGAEPAIIWRIFMQKALANTPPSDFYRPSGIYIPPDPVIEKPKDSNNKSKKPQKPGQQNSDKNNNGSTQNKPSPSNGSFFPLIPPPPPKSTH